MSKSPLVALLLASLTIACSTPAPPVQSPPEYETKPSAAPSPAPSATEAAASSASPAESPSSSAAPTAGKPGAEPEECSEYRCTVPVVTDAVKKKIEAFKDSPDFELSISDATNESLKSVTKVPWVKQLTLRGDKVTDLTPVAQLKGLKKLDAYGCSGITDVKPLSGLSELVDISLYMTKVADIAPLSKLTKLESLDLYATEVTDLAPLKNLRKLKRLNLYMVKAKDWAPVADLTELEDIWLQFSNIKDLKILAKASKMKSLRVNWCAELADISAVANMPDLESIDLQDTAITTIAPMAKLKKLHSVDIGGTKVTDLSPLKASVTSKTLRTLEVPKGAEKAAQAFKKDLPELNLMVGDK